MGSLVTTAARASNDRAENAMSDAEFAAIVTMVREAAGIMLGGNKRELVFGRLNKRVQALGLRSFGDYIALLKGGQGEAERGEMINALTTNLTSFFRENHHFTFLAEEVFPHLLTANADKRIRIWSAACSSGEEPYSLAMTMNAALQRKGSWNARILATDIDTNMVATAQRGCYDAERASAIPAKFNA